MKRDERKDDFLFEKVFEKPQIRQMNSLEMFRKNTFRTKNSSFSFESSESYRVFNYLLGSNSIFRAARINSEKVSGRIVRYFLESYVYSW